LTKEHYPMRNRRVLLRCRPSGIAQAEHFSITEATVRTPGEGEFLVRNCFLSVEPAMRGWIADAGNYAAPIAVGDVMRALAVGTVIESRMAGVAIGDVVTGWFGWQDFATVGADALVRVVRETDLPISLALGVLGINGVTAYLALSQIGAPKGGETVLVSTAAGSVGSAVGQIAKIMGCRTIGVTRGPQKVALCLRSFGFDAAIDYASEDIDVSLAELCPTGIDVYFDNTAGSISDIVMRHLALRARVVVCGTAAIADWADWPTGPRVERHLLVRRARMEGFVIFDHMDRYDEAVGVLADWVRDGRLRYREDILDGIESCPDALAGLYRGENLGKRLVRLDAAA
jgi:NADPH-dependent curcumin reductase CurA